MDWSSKTIRALALVVMTLVAYAPALRDGFVWDDDQHVTENPTLTSLAGLQRIWLDPTALPQYYPRWSTRRSGSSGISWGCNRSAITS